MKKIFSLITVVDPIYPCKIECDVSSMNCTTRWIHAQPWVLKSSFLKPKILKVQLFCRQLPATGSFCFTSDKKTCHHSSSSLTSRIFHLKWHLSKSDKEKMMPLHSFGAYCLVTTYSIRFTTSCSYSKWNTMTRIKADLEIPLLIYPSTSVFETVLWVFPSF